MKRRLPLKRLLLIVGCLFFLSHPVYGKDEVIKLLYKPKSELAVRLKSPPPVTIYFEDFKDGRFTPLIIGENQENRKNFIRILTEDEKDVRRFVQEVMREEFRLKGLRIVSSPQGAEKRIGATVLKFWTLETRTYESETELFLEVKDAQGETLFQKKYAGSGTNRGRSLSQVNYQESISESLNRLMESILADPAFLAALAESLPEVKKEPPPTPRVLPAEKEEKEKEQAEAEKRRKMKEAEEKLLEEKRLQEIREAERRLEEKRLEEQRAAEKRLEELREEIRRLEEKRAQEKVAPTAAVETSAVQEEKTPSKGKPKKPSPAKTPPKSKETYFGPK